MLWRLRSQHVIIIIIKIARPTACYITDDNSYYSAYSRNKHLDCQLYTANIFAQIGHQLIEWRG